MPGERVKIDAVRDLFNVAQAIRILAGEHLLEHRHELVQVLLWRNSFSYGFAILRFGGEMRGVDDGFEEGQKGIGIGLSKFLRDSKSTAWVPSPDVFREQENKPGILVHGPLIKRIRGKIAIDIPGFQVCYHLWGRYHTDLHVFVRMQPTVGQVV